MRTSKKFVMRGIPTRWSTVQGLTSSPSSEKWRMFLQDGPYWRYMFNFLLFRKNMFGRRQDLIEEAVTNACSKIGIFFCKRKFVYPEAGKGYFRCFLKQVALRCAFDIIRREEKHEQGGSVDLDDDRECDLLEQAIENTNGHDVLDRVDQACTERDLDEYDRQNSLERAFKEAQEDVQKKRTGGRKAKGHLMSMDDVGNPFLDDEGPSTYDPASFFVYKEGLSKKDQSWVDKLQIHVLYISLCHLLTRSTMPAVRRELLRLRIGLDMRPKDIHARPDFAYYTEDNFNVKMKRAMDDLRKEARAWWNMVAPSDNDFSDEGVMALWRTLLDNPSSREMGKSLLRIAEKKGGKLK